MAKATHIESGALTISSEIFAFKNSSSALKLMLASLTQSKLEMWSQIALSTHFTTSHVRGLRRTVRYRLRASIVSERSPSETPALALGHYSPMRR